MPTTSSSPSVPSSSTMANMSQRWCRSISSDTMGHSFSDESPYCDDLYIHYTDEYDHDFHDNDVYQREIEYIPDVSDEEELFRIETERGREKSRPEAAFHNMARQSFATAEDTAIIAEKPSTRVDYLTYPWREEDLWTSWRHLVSHRHSEVESERLENAAWRVWAQRRFNPGANLEDTNLAGLQDTAWLYGPMKSYISREQISMSTSLPPPREARNREPSLSLSPILKNAFLQPRAIIPHPCGDIAAGTVVHDTLQPAFTHERSSNGDDRSLVGSIQKTRAGPTRERHVNFDTVVQQCIAIEAGECDDFDTLPYDRFSSSSSSSSSSFSDDDDVLFMIELPRRCPEAKGKPWGADTTAVVKEPRTIAPLASAWIKSHGDRAESSIETPTADWHDPFFVPIPPSTPPIDIPRPRPLSPSRSSMDCVHHISWDDEGYGGLNTSCSKQKHHEFADNSEYLETMQNHGLASLLELPLRSQYASDWHALDAIVDLMGTTDIVDPIWYQSQSMTTPQMC